MTITSKPAGLGVHKSGSYKGSYFPALREQGKFNREKDLADNGIFVANISAALKSVPKYVTGALAANSLMQAVMATKHDSSRAAANWNLAVSGKSGVSGNLSPLNYEESGPAFGKIGKKKSNGAFLGQVVRYKQTYYGIGPAKGATGVLMALPGGLLYNQLGIGLPGTPRVDLYNPIMGDLNRRVAGQGMGHSYAYYAFRGGSPASSGKDDPGSPSFLAGGQNWLQEIGNGYIPYLLLQLNQFIQKQHKAGAIPKL